MAAKKLIVNMCFVALLMLECNVAFCQSPLSVKVKDTFRPSFRVEPLVQRFTARRREVIPFRFSVESGSRDADIEIYPVLLKQDLDGKVLHLEGDPDTSNIQISRTGPDRVLADTPYYIEGTVTVPDSKADFYSFGIMIRELGRDGTDDSILPNNRNATKAGIRFVTQYIVRIDVAVDGVPGELANKLIIEDVKVVPVNGLPKLFAYVRNDTESSFEFSLTARVYGSPTDRSLRRLNLVLPVKETLMDESRNIGRIFPHSRVHLGSLFDAAIPTGDYNVDLELSSHGRIVLRKTFSIKIDAESFPAQQVQSKLVGKNLYFSPGQVMLSQARGGQRRASIEFVNNEAKAVTVNLKCIDQDDAPISDVIVQPQSFTLPPKGRRKIATTLRGSQNQNAKTVYGHVQVVSRLDGDAFDHTGDVPLAVQFVASEPAKLEASPIAFAMDKERPVFRVTVRNPGELHHAVDAKLTIVSEAGQRWEMRAGFGKWILPQETIDLDFSIVQSFPPGNYQLTCEIFNELQTLTTQQLIQVGNPDAAQMINN